MPHRVIRPDTKLVEDFVYQQEKFPIDKPVVQYIRQSTLGQVKHNLQSKIQQDEMLRKRLVKMGWLEEMIIKIEADQGKSGQKLRFQRAGLDALYRMIEKGEVGAVAAYDASRLWRDQTHVWYNDFIQMCVKYHIPVFMFNRVYWPNSQQDMDVLQEEFRQAAYALRHIYEKVIPAKMQAIEEGISYGGNCVPMGFVVVEKEDRKFYSIYEPHAELVRWLFKRYRELGGNLPGLVREVRATGFAFPAFSGVDKIPHVGLHFDGTCYPLRTRDALYSILTNPAYIGWYMFKGVVVSKEAHKSIVKMDDFLYAYNKLSNVKLDGEPNENKPIKTRQRKGTVKALLEGILESNGNPVYLITRHRTYTAVAQTENGQRAVLAVNYELLDKAFSGALRAVLVTLEKRKRDGIEDSLYAQLSALHEEKSGEVVSFENALAKIDKAIRGWELDKQSAREQEYKPGIDEANRQLKLLHADREAILAKAQQAEKEKEEIDETRTLTKSAIQQWESMKFDRQKRYVRLLVQSANIREVSPHIVRVDIVLREPLAGTLIGHVYRVHGSQEPWTPEEKDVIRRMYTHADRKDILQALPRRTWSNISLHAIVLNVTRSTRLNTSNIHEDVTYEDALLLQELGMEKDTALWKIEDAEMVNVFRRLIPTDYKNSETCLASDLYCSKQ